VYSEISFSSAINPYFSMLTCATKGFEIVGNFACKGFDNYSFVKHLGGVDRDRPDEKDLQEAADFA
jgi:hypothetical protein